MMKKKNNSYAEFVHASSETMETKMMGKSDFKKKKGEEAGCVSPSPPPYCGGVFLACLMKEDEKRHGHESWSSGETSPERSRCYDIQFSLCSLPHTHTHTHMLSHTYTYTHVEL